MQKKITLFYEMQIVKRYLLMLLKFWYTHFAHTPVSAFFV